jgi:hypothetical protein
VRIARNFNRLRCSLAEVQILPPSQVHPNRSCVQACVGAIQHVMRRGAVYWWRRRPIEKTGESDPAPIATLAPRKLELAGSHRVCIRCTLHIGNLRVEIGTAKRRYPAQCLKGAARRIAPAAFQNDERVKLICPWQDNGQAAATIANQFEPILVHTKTGAFAKSLTGFRSGPDGACRKRGRPSRTLTPRRLQQIS